ncbi:MAG TPA: DUF3108 domain-containing protein [Planctomycetota bacterium]|nr:DUF3108 domain-containing protein [Planctomycetota bacterium]
MFPVLLTMCAAIAAAIPVQSQKAKPPESGPLLVPRGEGFDPIEIPRSEELVFAVEVDVGILGDPSVGTVTLTSGVEPYRAGLPPASGEPKHETPQWVGWIRSQARGSALGYELAHELDVRHLPQTWPAIFYRDTQSGSENRRRELKLGVLDGKSTAILRNDGHCRGCSNPEHFVESAWLWGKPYHCEKCKRAEHRVWNDPHTRAIPPGTVDLLSAVYLARSMVRRGDTETTFAVLDKLKLWTLTIRRGSRKVIETPAGKFDCVSVSLSTAVPPGEPRDDKGFQGLFGIQGSIRIWMEAATGVPVTISGELPVPVVHSLELNVRLKSFRGTPPAFQPKP